MYLGRKKRRSRSVYFSSAFRSAVFSRLNNLIQKSGKGLYILFIITFIISGSGIYLLFAQLNKAEAAWLNDAWQYRRELFISGNSSDLENFQVRVININTNLLYSQGKLKKNCEDIRFTDIQGNILDHWEEDDSNPCHLDSSNDFWVKLNRLESEGTTIFMYYGNPYADTNSNPYNTFEYFDAFSYNSGSWYDNSWNRRQKITVLNSQVPNTDQTDFPVYVDLQVLGSEFFNHVKSDGADIVVTSSDGTTKLSRELVGIDTILNTGELWFKASTISASTDTEFYIYYDNPNGSEVNDISTWSSNYIGVYHMNDDPSGSGPQINDSTDNNEGTTNGSMSTEDLVEGRIGKAIEFDGVDDWINLGSDTIENDYTISGWFKATDESTSQSIFAATGGGNHGVLIELGTGGNARFLHRSPLGAVGGSNINTASAYDDNNWHFFTATHQSGTSMTLYIDGVDQGTITPSGNQGLRDMVIGRLASTLEILGILMGY